MGKNSAIEWTHHTFSPWWGCTRVSRGCEKCYAESFATKRMGLPIWGAKSERRFFGDKHWNDPLKWNRDAQKRGVRERVFCASMADWLEDRADLVPHRARLCDLVRDTSSLDWLLLTKRPENALALVPGWFQRGWPPNAWFGFSAEDQETLDKRAPHALAVPAPVIFCSYEPALGPADFAPYLPRHVPWTGTDPATWDDVPWPVWVPPSVRAEVAQFWSLPSRGPKAWREQHMTNYARTPPFGALVNVTPNGGKPDKTPYGGRYVHAWNNIARVVRYDGTVGSGVATHECRVVETPPAISWLISGAESGPNARPMDEAWVRSVRDQCVAAGTALFYKQKAINGKKIGTPELDGRTWMEFPRSAP